MKLGAARGRVVDCQILHGLDSLVNEGRYATPLATRKLGSLGSGPQIPSDLNRLANNPGFERELLSVHTHWFESGHANNASHPSGDGWRLTGALNGKDGRVNHVE